MDPLRGLHTDQRLAARPLVDAGVLPDVAGAWIHATSGTSYRLDHDYVAPGRPYPSAVHHGAAVAAQLRNQQPHIIRAGSAGDVAQLQAIAASPVSHPGLAELLDSLYRP